MKNKVFIILLCLLPFENIFAQKLQSPYVKTISYNKTDGKYYISWTNSNAQDLTGSFKIYVFDKMDLGQPFYDPLNNSVSATASTYPVDSIFQLSGTHNLFTKVDFFAVEAFPKTGNPNNYSSDNLSRKPWIDAPSNILLKAEFDSCSGVVTLTWNKFYGWDAGTSNRFCLFYGYNGIPDKKFDFNIPISTGFYDNTGDTFLVYPNKNYKPNQLIPNTVYYFQVVAYNNYDSCYSNIAVINTKTSVPEYITATGTEFLNNNQVNLSFKVDTTSSLHKYNILRSGKITGRYDTIARIDQASKTINFTDNVSSPDQQYFYKLVAINNCGVPVTESNVESTIPLKVMQNGDIAEISWLPYQAFEGSMNDYSVYRQIGSHNPELLIETPSTSVYDSINTGNEKGDSKICYYVIVTENNNPYYIDGQAKSNTYCIEISEKIIVPEYIVPGKNDYFKTSVTYQSTEFKMIIYDRWGSRVFETSRPDGFWNGKYPNNSDAPQGAYIYYIKVRIPNMPLKEQKGTFILIRQ